MAHEVETKVLNVDKDAIAKILSSLGADKVSEARLTVDWFREKGMKEGDDKWYLRIRSYSGGRSEVTWKGKSDVLGASRKHKEINFQFDNPEELADLFQEIGLEKYAHQEKDRISWQLKGWKFDLDQYPGMPAYLEIEGKDESDIQKALKLLKLENHKTSSEGERVLIQTEYALDWYNMKF